MPDDNGIVCRPRPSWPQTVAMFAGFGVAWLAGWGLAAACGVAVAASLIVMFLTPSRRFGRWTE